MLEWVRKSSVWSAEYRQVLGVYMSDENKCVQSRNDSDNLGNMT
jgi:hypothetical protein